MHGIGSKETTTTIYLFWITRKSRTGTRRKMERKTVRYYRYLWCRYNKEFVPRDKRAGPESVRRLKGSEIEFIPGLTTENIPIRDYPKTARSVTIRLFLVRPCCWCWSSSAASRDDLVRGQRKYRFIKLIKLGDTTIPVIIHKPDRVHVFNFRIRSCGGEEDGDIGRRNRFAQALECGSQFVYEHVRIQPA